MPFVSFILAYLIGTINPAWLYQKYVNQSDLRKQGSNNLGARNLYDVTGSMKASLLVGMFDVLKGAVAVITAFILSPSDYTVVAAAGAGVVTGHNYNVFLGWKGGRGLATALGVGAVLFPPIVITWGVMYIVGYYAIRRDIHVGSMTATIATFFIGFSMPESAIRAMSTVALQNTTELRILNAAICLLLFFRHLAPIREVMRAAQAETDDE